MGWWLLIRQEAEAGRLDPIDLHEALDTATDIAILDQERAGVDVITDGEMRRFGAFFRTYYSRINGIQTSPPERRLENWIALAKLRAMVEGTKIVRRELGYGV